MPNNKHVFLNNNQSEKPKFNRQRNVSGSDQEPNEEEEINQPKTIREYQKENLRKDNVSFYSQRRARNSNRTINFPTVIDLIRIYFYTTFNNNLKTKFYSNYGLSPVEYSHFNKTVMFEIVDEKLFQNFANHIQQVVNSTEGTSYEGQTYNLIALILHFEFINDRRRTFTTTESGILLTLISSSSRAYPLQKNALFNYLNVQTSEVSYLESSPDIIEVSNLSAKSRNEIAANFDIVKSITSTHVLKIRPGEYGNVRREFGFTVNIPENLTTVGIIDTGVNILEPLKGLIVNKSYDHTNNGAFWDEDGHGTSVVGLVTLGDEFLTEVKSVYTAKAKILVLKALHNNNDPINIPKILSDIKEAKRKHGVRLFNMSLNIPFAKDYNTTYSQFAYELDKLAYEEDILVFLSVGNIDPDYIRDMIETEPHPDHEYPTFFYKLDSTSAFHSCRNTNISEPAESLNNISVGALAGNLEGTDFSDITPNNLSPAYYSRKFHFDYTQNINFTPLQRNNRNKYLNKPDLVFEGGDLFKYEAGIEILRSPLSTDEKYYGRSCGTSLSTPLIASYAAEILNTYPALRTQSVKALLINAASYHKKNNLPDFRTSTEALLKSLTGFGKPQKESLLYTDDNSVIFVLEKSIKEGQIVCFPIYLPEYLKSTSNKLKFEITLCYSFMPIKDNHLNYLPMHMSVNIIRNADMNIIADGKQDAYGIKGSFSWSEDHFGLENRMFSNTQSIIRTLQPKDIIDVNGAIMLGARCLVKNEIPELSEYKANVEHPFSVVIKITELPESRASNQLYNEMIVCNEILNIGELEGDADIDIEVESA